MCGRVCGGERHREEERLEESTRETEREIQEGWKSQFRRISANGHWPTGRNVVRSAQDDNNKRLRSVSVKLERELRDAFTIGSYAAQCFNIRPSSQPNIPSPQACAPGLWITQALIVQNLPGNNLLMRELSLEFSAGSQSAR